jgi:hypothetical protein
MWPAAMAEQSIGRSEGAWLRLPRELTWQLEWERDPKGVRARAKERVRAARAENKRAEAAARQLPARETPKDKPLALPVLARRSWFSDWPEPLRKRARERIAKLIESLRAREIGTLEAESLDETLLAIARAVGIEPDAYGRAVDKIRNW